MPLQYFHLLHSCCLSWHHLLAPRVSSERQGRRRSRSRSWAGDSRSSTARYISNEGCPIPVPNSLHIHTLLRPPRAHAQQRNCCSWEVVDACPKWAIKHYSTSSKLEFGSNQSEWGIYGCATPMHLRTQSPFPPHAWCHLFRGWHQPLPPAGTHSAFWWYSS